ncbi:hypothetical protein [Qipengyuania gaetbuli]|uniref:hypothetical protein n=1 Tax=Qipengyuania gaetbuli TaxID=266952 RepID=UPI001CFE1DEB|nr:hypothetical protein [Qipengyuania gaetbuli]
MRNLISALALIFLVGCTIQGDVLDVSNGKEFGGLTDYEKSQFAWAAIDVALPSDTAQAISRWELYVHLRLFRCDDPEDDYPAPAHLKTGLLTHQMLENVGEPVTLTFFVPQHVIEREKFECAALDAAGYWPVSMRSETVRLPVLTFSDFR